MSDTFTSRHLGPRPDDVADMLAVVKVGSVDALIDEIIPADIRLAKPLPLDAGETEYGYHQHLRRIAAENRVCRSYIGLGYHDTHTPAVI